MRTEVGLPQWGMGQDEGTVTSWHVQVGDSVSAGQAIATVETAKVDGEVEAPVDGVIAEILVPLGDTVVTGTVLAIIESPGA